MRSRARASLLILANILIPIAILTFATGFFPYKPFLPGLAQFEELQYGAPPTAPFDKVVFMVVDALRSDFVYSADSGFKFTQSLISSGAAIPFTAHATSPTITMPRVKAITTGSIPSFLDVILNFAESDTTSTLAYQDTWLAQLKAKEGGKLVFYGDDTWLKLFPDTFARSDGTSSFFVSDFTEVDNNVTRHLPEELGNSDWNGMIMHYLGLDHIGHKTGPLGPNMIPKQEEMDGIVKQIYGAIGTQPHLQSTLLVLCGDHGMNEGGNHGGSAPGETSPALVFMSPKLKQISEGLPCPTTPRLDYDYYEKIEQSDIAPTLSALLGFPVPLNNLGVVIPSFFKFWTNEDDHVQLLYRNARQILTIVKQTFPKYPFDDSQAVLDCSGSSSSGHELACKWQRVRRSFESSEHLPPPAEALPLLEDFCRSAQNIMSSTASNYDVSRLVGGICIIAVSVVLTLGIIRPCFEHVADNTMAFFLLATLYGFMMFASSYVEEEQHFWYWSATAWTFYLGIQALRDPTRQQCSIIMLAREPLPVLGLLRLMRRWNQTGQKFAGEPDIVHSSLMTNSFILWAFVISTYAVIARSLIPGFAPVSRRSRRVATIAAWLLTVVAVIFKMAFVARDAPELIRCFGLPWQNILLHLNLIWLARLVFLGVVAGLTWLALLRSSTPASDEGLNAQLHTSTLHLLTLLLATQTRVSNIPLYLLFDGMRRGLNGFRLRPAATALTALLLAHASFFAAGGSNSISSIDLSNAYNGVSGYNVLAVGVLLFISNWAGPIYWVCAATWGLRQSSSEHRLADSGWQQQQHQPPTMPKPTKEVPEEEEQQEEVRSQQQTNPFFIYLVVTTAFTGLSLLAVMVACTVLRTHLFIWTVFSPKYLYAMAWAVGFHLGVNVLVGSLMWRMAGGKWWEGVPR